MNVVSVLIPIVVLDHKGFAERKDREVSGPQGAIGSQGVDEGGAQGERDLKGLRSKDHKAIRERKVQLVCSSMDHKATMVFKQTRIYKDRKDTQANKAIQVYPHHHSMLLGLKVLSEVKDQMRLDRKDIAESKELNR